MNKKSIFISIFIIIFSIFCGYSLAFGVNEFFGNEIKLSFKLSNNIYSDSLYLRNTKIAFNSKNDLSSYNIKGDCNIFSKFLQKKDDMYLFDLNFLDDSCKYKNIYLTDENNNNVLKINLKIINEYTLYKEFIDFKTEKLQKIDSLLEIQRLKYLKYNKFNNNSGYSYYEFLKNNRKLNEIIYNQNLIKTILDLRGEKYILPLKGTSLPRTYSKLPNSGRPYRSDYTDGIHHGWDFDGRFGEQVFAIDDGIIVRIVSNFEFSDLDKIKKGKNLSDDIKIKNLDILRGKQIWLKTMKGDVVFYSHLNDIFSNIEVGSVVRKGQPIGTIGITGIPDESYSDYHLHLPIHKNPYTNKVGEYDIEDYMKWDWYFKGEDINYVLQNQKNIFE